MFHRLGLACLALAMPALAACTVPNQAWDEDDLVLVNSAGQVAGPAPTWCYGTLADTACFTAPQPGADDRLVGAYVSVHDFKPAPTE
jgi:hypothetical protein